MKRYAVKTVLVGTMNYNGYDGSIETSEEDGCLFGKILAINDLVTYEAQSSAQLEEAFREAVEYYLHKCREENLTANRPSGDGPVQITQ